MIQMNVLFSEPDKNIRHASELVKSAKAKGAQICILPECMDLGWGNPEASSLAEPVPGKVSDAYQKIATENKVFLVAGLTEREQEKISGHEFSHEFFRPIGKEYTRRKFL